MDFSLYIGATGSRSSTQKPESDSRHLYAGHHPPSKQVPDGIIPGLVQDPGFDVIPMLSTLHLWFTFVRLSDSYMTPFIAPFPMTLTTLALDQRSSWLFKACPCRPALEGLLPSLVQLMHNYVPYNRNFLCACGALSRAYLTPMPTSGSVLRFPFSS